MSRSQRVSRALHADAALRRLMVILVEQELRKRVDNVRQNQPRQLMAVAFENIAQSRREFEDDIIPHYRHKGIVRSMLMVSKQFRQHARPLP